MTEYDDDYEELSEAEIQRILAPAPVMYYVYFDSNGKIDAITNEQRAESTFNSTELEYSAVEQFLKGNENIFNYRLVLVDKKTYAFVKEKEDGDISLNFLYMIKSKATDTTSCIVEWNKHTQEWSVSLQDDVEDLKLNATITFFLSLASNRNYLLRTFKVETRDLVNSKKVTFPFLSNLENNISKLSISTKKFFDSYGLVINE